MYKLKNSQQFMEQLIKIVPNNQSKESKQFYDNLDELINQSYTNNTYQITIPKNVTILQCDVTMSFDKDDYVLFERIPSNRWIYLHSGCIIDPNESYIITADEQFEITFATELTGSRLQLMINDLIHDGIDFSRSIKVIKKTSAYFIQNIATIVEQYHTNNDDRLSGDINDATNRLQFGQDLLLGGLLHHEVR